MNFGTLYRSRKSKDKFVNQPHLTKIVKIETFFVFLKKSKISILVSDISHESLIIIRCIFFFLIQNIKNRKFNLLTISEIQTRCIFYVFFFSFEIKKFSNFVKM